METNTETKIETKDLKYILLTTDGDKVKASWKNVNSLEIRSMLLLALQAVDKPKDNGKTTIHVETTTWTATKTTTDKHRQIM